MDVGKYNIFFTFIYTAEEITLLLYNYFNHDYKEKRLDPDLVLFSRNLDSDPDQLQPDPQPCVSFIVRD